MYGSAADSCGRAVIALLFITNQSHWIRISGALDCFMVSAFLYELNVNIKKRRDFYSYDGLCLTLTLIIRREERAELDEDPDGHHAAQE